MTDKELLELAAKANWQQELSDEEVSFRYSKRDDGMLYLHPDNQDHNGLDREFVWNPITDDGDALRLAVKLGVIIGTYANYSTVDLLTKRIETIIVWHSSTGNDPYAATRRAIVMAAAEIGKTK
jgi:hypothetical protein